MKSSMSGPAGWRPLDIPSPGSISILIEEGDGIIRVTDLLNPSRDETPLYKPMDSFFPQFVADAIRDLLLEIPNSGDCIISYISGGLMNHEIRVSLNRISDVKILVFWGGIISSRNESRTETLPQTVPDIPDLVSHHDVSLSFMSATPSAFILFGYHPSELNGISLLTFIHPDDRHQVESEYLPLLSKSGIRKIRYRLRNQKNEYLWVETIFSSIFSSEGYFLAISATTREMDAIIRAEQAVRSANAKLNLLNSIIRHDLMNQITGLIGYHEIIAEIIDDCEAKTLMNKQQEIIMQVRHLVDLSRDYQGIGLYSPGFIDIDAVLYKILARTEFSGKIKSFCSLKGLWIYADRMFEQVLYEMVSNTLIYGGEGVTVRFHYLVVDEELLLIIEDNGPGIEDNAKKNIFNRNYTKRHRYGLYLAGEILDITGIRIREVGVYGEGARFEIVVPPDGFRLHYSEK
jgi:PAS domain S-box-containing protein